MEKAKVCFTDFRTEFHGTGRGDKLRRLLKFAGFETIDFRDKFVAITVLAAGTSLPELATSCIAAAKGKGQLALGNILGSNTSNILLVLGGSAVISPLSMGNINLVDYAAVFICAFSLVLFSWTGKKNRIDRLEGILLVLIQVAYFVYLFWKK